MVPYCVDHAGVVVEGMDQVCVHHIPQLNGAVVGPWRNHPWVKWKLRTPDPVLVPRKTLDKFTFLHIPDLHEFIVARGHQQWAIWVECDALDWCWMPLHYGAGSWGVIAPDTHSLVSWTGGNQCAPIVDCDISDWSLMACELVWSGVGSKSPRENGAIVWTGDDLLETWMKNSFGDAVFVALERLEECGISCFLFLFRHNFI